MKGKTKKVVLTVLICLLIQYVVACILFLLDYFGIVPLDTPLYSGICGIVLGFLYLAFRKLKKCQDPAIQKTLKILGIVFISFGIFFVLLAIFLF